MTELTESDFEAKVTAASPLTSAGALALYVTYREAVGGIAYNGEKIPEWANIKWRAKWGWVCAYSVARTIVRMESFSSPLGHRPVDSSD